MPNLSNGSLLTGTGLDGNDLAQVSTDDLARQPNRGIIPRFFTVARKNDKGGFSDVEYVEILVPGDSKSIPCHLVDDVQKRRFAPQYRAWKEGLSQAVEGTPIELLVGATAQMFTLKSLNITTVEQMANLTDGQLGAVGMGARDLRDRANRFLDNKKKLDTQEDADRKDAEIRDLKAEMAQLRSLILKPEQAQELDPDAPVDPNHPPAGAVPTTTRPKGER